MRTFFLQAFEIEHEDYNDPEIWLGTSLEEFPSFDSLVTAVWKMGYRIDRLDSVAILSVLAEAEGITEPTLEERFRLIR